MLFNVHTKKCHLCLYEKLEVASYTQDNLVIKKTELITKYPYQNK